MELALIDSAGKEINVATMTTTLGTSRKDLYITDSMMDVVRANSERQMRTYVNVNNHYEGSAPATIQRLLGVLQEEVRDA